uniref:Uncharacterized protein n=1 Tax=Arundo donax TaxID=35708 RepID=A0A0A8YKM1_ARUDO
MSALSQIHNLRTIKLYFFSVINTMNFPSKYVSHLALLSYIYPLRHRLGKKIFQPSSCSNTKVPLLTKQDVVF